MKTSNQNNIKIIFYSYIALLLITVICLSGIFFIPRNDSTGNSIYLKSLFTILLLFLIIKTVSLKCFNYEHSGEVISIWYYHPIRRGRVLPSLEVPQNKVTSFNISEKTYATQLFLTIHGNKTFRFTLKGMPYKKIEDIKRTLAHTKS